MRATFEQAFAAIKDATVVRTMKTGPKTTVLEESDVVVRQFAVLKSLAGLLKEKLPKELQATNLNQQLDSSNSYANYTMFCILAVLIGALGVYAFQNKKKSEIDTGRYANESIIM